MQRIVTLAAVTAIALATTPALAKSKKHIRVHDGYHAQPYVARGAPWVSRNVSSDPSFGNRSGINYARGTGRCVEDLGYGRFEYCGW